MQPIPLNPTQNTEVKTMQNLSHVDIRSASVGVFLKALLTLEDSALLADRLESVCRSFRRAIYQYWGPRCGGGWGRSKSAGYACCIYDKVRDWRVCILLQLSPKARAGYCQSFDQACETKSH